MWFVAIGAVLVLFKLVGWGAVALWSWWWVLAPFALAALWWTFSDASGLTRRKAAAKEDQRVEKRRQRHFEAMGLGTHPRSGPRRPPVEQDPPP